MDDCDTEFDKCQKATNECDVKAEKILDIIADVIKRLEDVSPLNNPIGAQASERKKDFVRALSEKIDEATKLRTKVEQIVLALN